MKRYYKYYDRYKRPSGKGSKFLIFGLLLVAAFLYKDPLLDWLNKNEDTVPVPEVVKEVLGREVNLQEFKNMEANDLKKRLFELDKKAQELEETLIAKAGEGKEKLVAIQKRLLETQKALTETQEALQKLNSAGQNLKDSFQISGESPESASTEGAEQ